MDWNGLTLTHLNKLSVLRLALDLVKADRCIHGDEVRILSELQSGFGLSQDDLNRIHYITLQQAADNLSSLDETTTQAIISMLNELMCIDNAIDYEENVLLTSIRMSIDSGSRDWCRIISSANVMDETTLKQIIYLEDGINRSVHETFGNRYDKLLITKAFNDLGLDFFYLPDVLDHLKGGMESDRMDSISPELLNSAMKYLVPSGSGVVPDRCVADIDSFDPDSFFHFLLSRYNISQSSLKADSFLLLKIRDSYILDDENNLTKTVDFLVMDMDRDVKERIYSFVSNFDKKRNRISYQGCYKILYDYLSSESRNVSQIVLNDRYEFFLQDSSRQKVVFESSPQARTFYLLLLRYKETLISQQCYEDAVRMLQDTDKTVYTDKSGSFDIEAFKSWLLKDGSDHAIVIYNAIVIYSCISTKDCGSVKFLDYIENIFSHRSSLKNYINKGFMAMSRLADSEKYRISYDGSVRTYNINAEISSFMMETDGAYIPLCRSGLWEMLK